jgi:hypothetical protein
VLEEVINTTLAVVDMASAALAMIGGHLRAAHEGARDSSQVVNRPVILYQGPFCFLPLAMSSRERSFQAIERACERQPQQPATRRCRALRGLPPSIVTAQSAPVRSLRLVGYAGHNRA